MSYWLISKEGRFINLSNDFPMKAFSYIINEALDLLWSDIPNTPNIFLCADSNEFVEKMTIRRGGKPPIVAQQAKLINAYHEVYPTKEGEIIADLFFNWEVIKKPPKCAIYEKINGIVIHEVAEARVSLEDVEMARELSNFGNITNLPCLPSNIEAIKDACSRIRSEYLANVKALTMDVRPEPLFFMYVSSFVGGKEKINETGRTAKINYLKRNAPYTWFEIECLNIPQMLHQIAGIIAIIESNKLFNFTEFSQTQYLKQIILDYLNCLSKEEKLAGEEMYSKALNNSQILEDEQTIGDCLKEALVTMGRSIFKRRIPSCKKRLDRMYREQRRSEIRTLLQIL